MPDAHRRDAAERQRGHRQGNEQQVRVDPAQQLQQAEYGEPGEQEHGHDCHSPGQFPQDDFPASKVGGQDELQGAPFLVLGDRSRDHHRREDRHDDHLNREEDEEERECRVGLGLEIDLVAFAVPELRAEEVDVGDDHEQQGGVYGAVQVDALPAAAKHLEKEDRAQQADRAAAHDHGQQSQPCAQQPQPRKPGPVAADPPAASRAADLRQHAEALIPGPPAVRPRDLPLHPPAGAVHPRGHVASQVGRSGLVVGL